MDPFIYTYMYTLLPHVRVYENVELKNKTLVGGYLKLVPIKYIDIYTYLYIYIYT